MQIGIIGEIYMKKILALTLVVFMLVSTLCGCGDSNSADPTSKASASTADKATDDKDKKSDSTALSTLPATFEIAATDPHYVVSIPDWKAESYGCGFALNEKGNKKYAIVVACASAPDDSPLEQAVTNLYNDNFNGILMQNYRAKYAEFALETTETKLKDGTAALRFEGNQSADDYGTEMSCPIYGYGFSFNGMPFIIASIVMDEAEADSAKQAEMKGYVDEMINTVSAQQ